MRTIWTRATSPLVFLWTLPICKITGSPMQIELVLRPLCKILGTLKQTMLESMPLSMNSTPALPMELMDQSRIVKTFNMTTCSTLIMEWDLNHCQDGAKIMLTRTDLSEMKMLYLALWILHSNHNLTCSWLETQFINKVLHQCWWI